MVRQYVQVTDSQRHELIRLIHSESHSIAKASKVTGIPYDNAKAINRTYLRERRVNKINYRLRYQQQHSIAPVLSRSDFKNREESSNSNMIFKVHASSVVGQKHLSEEETHFTANFLTGNTNTVPSPGNVAISSINTCSAGS